MKKIISAIIVATTVMGCSLAPGMHFSSDKNIGNTEYVFLDDEKNIRIPVQPINLNLVNGQSNYNRANYLIGRGDSLNVTIWGLPEIFPMNVADRSNNMRIVNAEGAIFFPYVGTIIAEGRSPESVREEITTKLSKYFTDPQVDVSISGYNSQKIYILGEVTSPRKINLTETPLSLSDALGEALGLKTDTSAANEVFVIRDGGNIDNVSVFKADMSSPSGFLIANSFILQPEDIVYVNAKGTARWNRVISQFFPFSSLLNSVDNLVQQD